MSSLIDSSIGSSFNWKIKKKNEAIEKNKIYVSNHDDSRLYCYVKK